MNISVIIPVYNEGEVIAETIESLRRAGDGQLSEIIVVDGGSSDHTAAKAREAGARVLEAPQKGRACQMNYGAREAGGELLYFLHADSQPPPHFTASIGSALDRGHQAGCFRLSFDDDHWLLKLYAWFTRFDIDAVRFGDQSLFITQKAFGQIGGFRQDHIVMEDQEIVRRIKQSFSFEVLDRSVTTSARKYRETGIVKLQLVFSLIFVLYYMGLEQERLVFIYKRFIQ
ncbi:TIGR04283 family arsenosugar biosynthesis glycosyltransferase [Fodinibius sediminis]|uniref:Transferase 2, rSAM/selenodomain-associated n=1 Tax=Fodinibius sediminis TaxID=1214077 RepID=A0A521AFQ9_9BACT|nr:TIGR04283 family arsenosugar biosynthesis glycosyltransferase [Fodinibius sediminis]SMO33627.1 transferase 2, rSAM/selenodomain-associated [Fodinibius sediminis]